MDSSSHMLISPCVLATLLEYASLIGEATCLFFGCLSRPPEIPMNLNSWNIFFDMLCVSDYNKDGLVYKSLWLRIQEVDILMLLDLLFSAKFKKSFGIVDHMLICVPWQREIWLRRANQMIDGVTPCELLMLHSDAEVKDSLKRMRFFFDFQVCLLQVKSQDYGYIGFTTVARIGVG
ncbi:unnamed protein product [Cochlearia groenlandica]